MTRQELIDCRVHSYYWDDDINCATTMLKILAEISDFSLAPQVLHAAAGMHGGGGFGAQCGLVEGALMFIGVVGAAQGLPAEVIAGLCYDFSGAFCGRFGSLLCRELRPEGFKADNPPHLCEALTKQAVAFAADYMEKQVPRV